MDRRDRSAMVRRYGAGLLAIVGIYLVVTIARGVRADFAPELWRDLGTTAAPSTFATSEMIVAVGVLIATRTLGGPGTSVVADATDRFGK